MPLLRESLCARKAVPLLLKDIGSSSSSVPSSIHQDYSRMFLQIWPLLSYFICATISLVLNSGILINLNAPVSGVTRLESPTATPLSTWAPVCDANLYGTPPLAGCREAVAKLRNRGEGAIVPYRQRGSPLFPGALSLPARYSSCKFDFGLIRYDWLFIRLTAC